MSRTKSEEIDRNLEKLRKVLPEIMPEHGGQYALMRHGDIVEFFPDALDAQIAGNQKFEDNIFSIQCVQTVTEQLGYFSYAVDTRKS
jgi:hypothetical protein